MAAGEGEDLEERDGAVGDEAAGAVDVSDDVDDIGGGDDDGVIFHELDVGCRIGHIHDVAGVDVEGVVFAGGVDLDAFEGDFALVDAAGYADLFTDFVFEAAGVGDEFPEGFGSAEVAYAGAGDGAEDGDGAWAELGDGDDDLGVVEGVRIPEEPRHGHGGDP